MTDEVASVPHLLLVDDSRIVRASLIKRIGEHYSIREEADGEAGWQALLSDESLQLVISDLSMPRLDGYGLLARIRSSEVRRIRDIPVVIISGEEDETSIRRARDAGASDFITKGTSTTELLTRLATLLKLAQRNADLAQAEARTALDAATGLPNREMLLRLGGGLLSHARRHGGQVCALSIGLDQAAQIGVASERVLAHIARALQGRMRQEDVLGRWGPTELAIITQCAEHQARALAERLCRAIAAQAKLQMPGGPLPLTVSIGIAHYPAPELVAEDAQSLLMLAQSRGQAAHAAGGNRVASGPYPSSPHQEVESLDTALADLMRGVNFADDRLQRLTYRLLPLLRLMQHRYGVDLALDALEQRLNHNATREPAR